MIVGIRLHQGILARTKMGDNTAIILDTGTNILQSFPLAYCHWMESNALLGDDPWVSINCIVAGCGCAMIHGLILPDCLQRVIQFSTTHPNAFATGDAKFM